MKKQLLMAAAAVAALLPILASANGLNLNGLGTRAQAMGGAFVGIADDFSAVFWNPAGAAGFRQEMFGFSATDLMPRATFRQWPLTLEVPVIDAKTPASHYLNFLGAYYRPVGPKVVIGIGISTPSGFGTTWNGEDLAGNYDGTVFSWSSRYRLFAISPLIAVGLTRWLSVGATFNFQYGTLDLMKPSPMDFDAGIVDLQYEENTGGWGFGATFGVLAKPLKRLAIGLAVRTPSSVSYKGTARMPELPLYGLQETSELWHKITWPLWIGGGVSFKPFEGLLLSADVQWTQWSEVRQTSTYLDQAWLLHMAVLIDGDYTFGLPYLSGEDTTQLRFGVEYALNATTALRAGYYSDPSPRQFATHILFPSHDFNAFTIGIGTAIGGLQLDLGLEYLAGNERSNDTGVVAYSRGMNIVVPSVSIQYKF
jgi:long-chain fatty acid transport protein